MKTGEQKQASMTKLSAEDVRDALFHNVSVPVFIKACAERGVEFTTEQELSDALNIGGQLAQAEAAQSTKLVANANRAFAQLTQ